jgi:hypothetical protein
MSADRGDIMMGAHACADFLSELFGEPVPDHMVYRYIDRGTIPGGRVAAVPRRRARCIKAGAHYIEERDPWPFRQDCVSTRQRYGGESGMSLIFSDFPGFEKAREFIAAVRDQYHLAGQVFDSEAAAQRHDPFPLRQGPPPIVHIDRSDPETEDGVIDLVETFGGEFLGT